MNQGLFCDYGGCDWICLISIYVVRFPKLGHSQARVLFKHRCISTRLSNRCRLMGFCSLWHPGVLVPCTPQNKDRHNNPSDLYFAGHRGAEYWQSDYMHIVWYNLGRFFSCLHPCKHRVLKGHWSQQCNLSGNWYKGSKSQAQRYYCSCPFISVIYKAAECSFLWRTAETLPFHWA